LHEDFRRGSVSRPVMFGTLQQMWERVCPAKRREGGARCQQPHTTQGRRMQATDQSPKALWKLKKKSA
ncbi:hypothetical protein, partial [Pseudomonas sp. SIMBA_067]|uniref:hypothetical protein n=1 Tax=Pseudomonas sp. SIMBA_067 TaxID=3085807 RepID=UPI00397B3A4F